MSAQASKIKFEPKIFMDHQAAFKTCLKKVLPPYKNRKSQLMIFDTCFGYRLYIGVIENQDSPDKQLLVIGEKVHGKDKARVFVVNDIFTFISRLSKGTLNFTNDCKTTPGGDLQLIYPIK